MQKLHLKTFVFILLVSLPCISFGQNWRLLRKTSILVPASVSTVNTYVYDKQTNRGSNYNSSEINYDSLFLGNDLIGLKSYNNNDQLLSASFYGTYTGTLSRIEQADSFTYANGLVARQESYKYMSVGGNPVLGLYLVLDYTYNAQSLPETRSVTGYNGKGSPDPNVMWNYYTYNANGQLIQDSVRMNKSGVWSEFQLYDITYDANGDTILWEMYDRDNLGNRVEATKKYFYYDVNGRLAGDSLVDYIGATPVLQETHTYVYNASGQLVADTGWYNGPFASTDVTTYTYTSFGYYKERTNGMLNGSGKVDLNTIVLYDYELHWPVSINALANHVDETVTLYPNPAVNTLHIDAKMGFDKGKVFNAAGQMVKVLQPNATQVDINNLPAGQYYLQITTLGKTVSKQFVIVQR